MTTCFVADDLTQLGTHDLYHFVLPAIGFIQRHVVIKALHHAQIDEVISHCHQLGANSGIFRVSRFLFRREFRAVFKNDFLQIHRELPATLETGRFYR